MATISSLGLSGLPLSDLLADLRKVEEAPLALLKDRKTGYETKISAYGILSSTLSALQASTKVLADANTFSALKTSSSNATALTAVAPADGKAVPGNYSVHIANLATSQSLATASQASRTQAIGSTGATVNITLGDGTVKELQLEAGDTSLEGIRTAINKAGLGISATLVNNGDASNPHQLVISANNTGTAASISKIEVSGNADLQTVLGYEKDVTGPVDGDGKPLGISQKTEAKDANITVNGIAITSGSNTVKDAVEGLTLNLLAATQEDAPITLKVEENPAVAKAAIEGFVSAYNALQSVITQLTSYDAEKKVASALTGDRIPRTMQSQLRGVLSSGSDNGGFSMLSQLGITTNITTGALTIDAEKLTKALADNKEDIALLFSGKDGLAKKLESAAAGMLGPDGLLNNATEGIKASVSKIDDQVERTELRIEDTMSRYQAQFVQLEKYMSQMNGISSYLTTQLEMLESMSKGKK